MIDGQIGFNEKRVTKVKDGKCILCNRTLEHKQKAFCSREHLREYLKDKEHRVIRSKKIMTPKETKKYLAFQERIAAKLELDKQRSALRLQEINAKKAAKIEAERVKTEEMEKRSNILKKRNDHVHMNSLEKINLSKAPKFDKREWYNRNLPENNEKVNELLAIFKKDTGIDLQEEVKNKNKGNGNKDHESH